MSARSPAHSTEIDPSVDIEDITELFLNALSDPDATTAQKLQRIGAVARSTATVSEAVRRDVIAQRLPSHDWPDRDLRITAIDIGTGELVAFDRKSGVELVDAVAASCAVPGAWPPVTIGERRYMDGGVGSTMNLKLAADCDAVVVLVPSGKGAPSPFGRDPGVEVDALPRPRTGGVRRRRLVEGVRRQPAGPGLPGAVRACRTRAGPPRRRRGRRLPGRLIRLPGP